MSSQLTFIFFRGVAQPPTSIVLSPISHSIQPQPCLTVSRINGNAQVPATAVTELAVALQVAPFSGLGEHPALAKQYMVCIYIYIYVYKYIHMYIYMHGKYVIIYGNSFFGNE